MPKSNKCTLFNKKFKKDDIIETNFTLLKIFLKKVLTNPYFYAILLLASLNGFIAQLARARGSYPRCHWFESS